MMVLSKVLVLAAVAAPLSLGAKDSDYYPPGIVNPNVNLKMYWKDAINVLQDLDKFESLHVLYHGCAWSKYGARYSSGDYNDFNDQDKNDGQRMNLNNGCGGDGGEYYWYLGRTQCFRANVAFSLYGILKGASQQGNFCQKSTFINSFFTNFGVESFGGPLGLDVTNANSQCATQQPEDGQSMYYEVDEINDDNLSGDPQFLNYEAFTSYGTGCSSGKFVIDKYSGAFCRGDKYMETIDTLDSFNNAIESLGCTQIYSSSNGRKRVLGEKNSNFEDMSAVNILAFSTACDVRQYPQECPDPYGKEAQYASNMERSVSSMTMYAQSGTMAVANFLAILLTMSGMLFFALSYRVHLQTVGELEHLHDQQNLRRIGPSNGQNPARSSHSERLESIGYSDAHDFWKQPRTISETARRLKEKFQLFTQNSSATQERDQASSSADQAEAKRSRFRSISRSLFGKR